MPSNPKGQVSKKLISSPALIHQSSTRNSKIALVPKEKNGGEHQSKFLVKQVFIANITLNAQVSGFMKKN